MKKTFNINLAGYPFTIDEDAYQLLKDYLDTIRYAFETKEDTGELASDIESRIAELLIQNEKGGVRIVTLEEISQVIARIGRPSDFIEVEEKVETSSKNNNVEIEAEEGSEIKEETTVPPPYPGQSKYENPLHKKLYRDPNNTMIGGVCSGLAIYLGIDVTLIRLLTVLLFFLSASTVAIVYIILWIVVPEARTPFQRMQMMGEDPTVENIGKTITENFQDNGVNENLQTRHSGIGRFIGSVCSIFVKCLVIICLIIGIPVILAIFLVLVACIIAFFAGGAALIGGSVFGDTFNFQAPGGGVLAFYLLLASLGAIITIGVPFWLLVRMAFKNKVNNLSPNNRRSILVIWLIGIALLAVFTPKTAKKTKEITRIYNNEKVIENLNIDDTGVTIEGRDGNSIILDEEGIKIKKKPDDIERKDSIIEMSVITEVTKDTI